MCTVGTARELWQVLYEPLVVRWALLLWGPGTLQCYVARLGVTGQWIANRHALGIGIVSNLRGYNMPEHTNMKEQPTTGKDASCCTGLCPLPDGHDSR